jgi:hypothetical protein
MTLLETTLNNKRRNLKITTQQLAVLSGVREQKLVPGLSGRVPLHLEDIEKVRRALSRVQELVDLFRPLPLDLSNRTVVALLIRLMESGELKDPFVLHMRQTVIPEIERALFRTPAELAGR